MLALYLMGFAALLRQAPIGEARPKTVARRQHILESRNVEALIADGERVVAFMESTFGHQQASVMQANVARRASGSQPSVAEDASIHVVDDDPAQDIPVLPYGFWRRFLEDDMQTQYTNKKRKQFCRALEFYVLRTSAGADTRTAMRGMRNPGSCRSSGGSLNARKAEGLGFSLLQFFVDHVQRLQCRADSCLLMKEARDMRADLEARGWPMEDLPKLIGNTGAQWFKRWRETYGIVKKVCGMKLKVPWAKVKRRIHVLLGNIYRLRAFWELCHPGVAMRFLSLDQKPSWFNNAGHTGTFAKKGGSQPSVRENFNKTRERYTILTSVPSWGHIDPDVPPKVAILFKAKPNGAIIRELRASALNKPWMKMQVQENGSYRSEDMVEALDWMLPDANESNESIVVLLDWYSGHLTEEVANKVRSKGHVLLFHGGGTTPFTQINDTHLHALLASLLIQIENDWARKDRRRLVDVGLNKTPTLKREDIMSVVQTAWLSIDHGKIAEKGYKQTGPTMPLRGSVKPENVFKDLLRAMLELEPSSTPLEVGMTLRDKAVAYVKEGWDTHKWRRWADCYKLIEEQDGLAEGLPEGLEAFGESATDTESEGSDDSDDKDGGDDGGGPDGLSAKKTLGHSADHDASREGDAEGDGGPSGPAGGIAPGASGIAAPSDAAGEPSSSAAGSEPSMTVAVARQVLYDDAVRSRDDVIVRHMRKRMREETLNERDAATKVGVLLRERAQEHRDAEYKRHQEGLEKERLAAKDLEASRALRAKAEHAAAEARLAALKQIIENRRDAQARRRQEIVDAAFRRWLQTQYPAMLARRCIISWQGLSKPAQVGFQRLIVDRMKAGTFQRPVFIKDLWSCDGSFTNRLAMIKPFLGGPPRAVRCSLCFQAVVDPLAPRSHTGHDPVETLFILFSACVPQARRVFTGHYTPLRLLHVNDYVLEKAFVYGIVALSKWLGEENFPQGVFGHWPPNVPEGLVAEWTSAATVDVDTVASTSSPLSSGHLDDAHLPPHLRVGSAAASSSSAPPP